MNNRFMKVAIDEAKKSSESLRCGVAIVKNGEVIAKAFNTQHHDNNPRAHAEVNALMRAGQLTGNKNLSDCEIFCTCEPCIMCLTAIAFSKIRKIYYGVNLRDVSPKDKLVDISIDTFLASTPYKLQVERNFMESECKAVSC